MWPSHTPEKKNVKIFEDHRPISIFSMVVLAHAQGTSPWNMLVFSKHGLGWGGMLTFMLR